MKTQTILQVATILGTTLLLSACGGGNDSSAASTAVVNTAELTAETRRFTQDVPGFPLAEPLHVSLMGRHMGFTDWEDMAFWQAFTEATNIHFEFNTPPHLDMDTHLNLALATGNLPDVLFGLTLSPAVQIEQGTVGAIIPLQDLIANYAPNLTQLLDQNPIIRNSITAPDGNIYSLPTINLGFHGTWPIGPVYYNGMWLQALDAQIPTTLDEFTDLMFRFRDEIPAYLGVDQVFPISATDGFQHLRRWMLSFFGISNGGTVTGEIEAIDGVVRHASTTDNYRAFLEWMHMAFSEGLTHPELFSLANDHQDALGRANMIGFFQTWHSHWFLGTPDEQGFDNPMLRALRSDYSPHGVLPMAPGFGVGALSISSSVPDPGSLIRAFDFFYSEEGAAFLDFGPEGHLWVWEDHAVTGEPVRVYHPDVDLEDGARRGRFAPVFGFPGPTLLPADAPRILRSNDEPVTEAFNAFLRSETDQTIAIYGRVPVPPIMLTAQEAESIALINADLALEIAMVEAQFISGLRPLNDTTWAEFQATLVNIGVEEVVTIWQTALDRWNAQ